MNVVKRLIWLVLLLILVQVTSSLDARETALAKSPAMTIAGPDLRGTITLPFQQLDLFWKWQPFPGPASGTPEPQVAAYSVRTDFWSFALMQAGFAGQVGPDADETALVYPDQNLVHSTLGGSQYWLQLDERRRQLIADYVAMGRAGLVPFRPSVLDYTAAVQALRGGVVVEVAGRGLGQDALDALLAGASHLTWREDVVPGLGSPDTRRQMVEVRLRPYGNVMLQLAYLPSAGVLVDIGVAEQAQNFGVPVPVTNVPDDLELLLRVNAGATRYGAASNVEQSPTPGSNPLASVRRNRGRVGYLLVATVAGGLATAMATAALARRHRAES